jgi:hypothetical protein
VQSLELDGRPCSERLRGAFAVKRVGRVAQLQPA